MTTVYDLKKVIDTLIGSYKNADNFLVMTKLPGKEPTSIVEFSVDDEKLYLSSDSKDNDAFTVFRLRNYITREAEEECWKDEDSFMSRFYDCDVCIYDEDEEITYNLSDIKINGNKLLLVCSDNEENKNDGENEEEEEEEEKNEENSIKKITVSVTISEAKCIAEALNYFGDKIADSRGYSAGEKYWDISDKYWGLVSKFSNE